MSGDLFLEGLVLSISLSGCNCDFITILTATASVSMPHPTPVMTLPQYSIGRFSEKNSRSQPSSKGMAPTMMATLRPSRSTAGPAIIHPNKAPIATSDCNQIHILLSVQRVMLPR